MEREGNLFDVVGQGLTNDQLTQGIWFPPIASKLPKELKKHRSPPPDYVIALIRALGEVGNKTWGYKDVFKKSSEERNNQYPLLGQAINNRHVIEGDITSVKDKPAVFHGDVGDFAEVCYIFSRKEYGDLFPDEQNPGITRMTFVNPSKPQRFTLKDTPGDYTVLQHFSDYLQLGLRLDPFAEQKDLIGAFNRAYLRVYSHRPIFLDYARFETGFEVEEYWETDIKVPSPIKGAIVVSAASLLDIPIDRAMYDPRVLINYGINRRFDAKTQAGIDEIIKSLTI